MTAPRILLTLTAATTLTVTATAATAAHATPDTEPSVVTMTGTDIRKVHAAELRSGKYSQYINRYLSASTTRNQARLTAADVDVYTVDTGKTGAEIVTVAPKG